jgi:hypothetical protein
LGELNPGNSQKPYLRTTLKNKQHGRLATPACCSTISGLLTHNVSSDPSRLWEPQHLVGPYETFGTATSRQTLRDSGNRNISSGPSRLWEPQHLVGPYETLGTATSRQTLRDSWNRNISSDPSRLWEPQTSRRTLRDSGNRNISSDPSKLWEPYTAPTEEGCWVMFLSIEKAPAAGTGAFSCTILSWSSECSRNLRRFFRMLRPHHIDLRVRGHRHS